MDFRARLLILLIAAAVLAPASALADDPANLQSQIDQHNAQITQLQNDIAAYQKQLDTLGAQHQTLQTAINGIDVSRQQTSAQISVTQNKIAAANLKLQQLSGQITNKQYEIDLDKQTLAQSMREVQAADDSSIAEQIFSADSLADAWAAVDQMNALNGALRANTLSLSSDAQVLTSQQNAVLQTKSSLTDLDANLTTQKKQLDANKAAKAALLSQTKSQESTYQSLIAEKKAQQKAEEAALAALQATLKGVGASSVPNSGAGILAWPFSASVMATCPGKAKALGAPDCITQYFGDTDFSTANPQVYNGMGHDGLDIGVPIGTPVQAALDGTVLATGNTDIKAADGRMCYSFGKWVMIQHPDGLSTLYGHLSEIDVSKGQAVTTGQVIGLSGMTGYATGPHLHFGVYASAGVQIMDLASWRAKTGGSAAGITPCMAAGAILPVAPTNAYLNPLSYLPAT